MTTGSVSLHRVLRAPPERIHRTFLDADAMVRWRPMDPGGSRGLLKQRAVRAGPASGG